MGSGASLLAICAGAAAKARTIAHGVQWNAGQADTPESADSGFPQFFSPEEAAFIDAAVARLIPADNLGPGAYEAGVTAFLDRQLGGAYGRAETWYTEGPWQKGNDTQGYQSRLTPADFYRTAIKAIDDHCRKSFGGKRFSELAHEQQDSVLTALEKGQIDTGGVGPHPLEVEGTKDDSFFAVLMQNTLEGFFSDPLYGGNRGMAGWRLIGFPGAHYDYRPYVAQHGKKLAIQPVGLRGGPEWNSKS